MEACDVLKDIETVLTFDEADDSLHKNQKAPSFSFVVGEKTSLPAKMMYKKNMNKEAKEDSPLKFKTLTRAPKLELPMFSFTVDEMVTAIVLDVENGLSMKKFLEGIKDLTYIAYFSARSEIEAQRFRVIIPLSEPIEARVYDYCKERLMKVFNEIPDIHSFESNRFFFMPGRIVGDHNDANVVKAHRGKSIDFIKTVDFTDDDMKDLIEKEEEQKNAVIKHKNVEDNPKVQYYLTNDFPLMQGNGDSASSFYTAIYICLKNDDPDTLEKVIEKAKSERWSDKEIEHNIKCAKKNLGIE